MTTERDVSCPFCGRMNELHDGSEPGSTPKPGDVSLCWGCGGLGFFQDDMTIRKATVEELLELRENPDVVAAQEAVRTSSTPEEASQKRWSS